MNSELHPIGIMPERIWKLHRIEDLRQAIKRYIDAELTVPEEWVEEWMRLCREVTE
jgi:hypothetical protein